MYYQKKFFFGLLVAFLLFAGVEIALRVGAEALGRATIPAEEIVAHVESGSHVQDPLLGWVQDGLPDPGKHIDINGIRRREPMFQQKSPGTWRAFTFGDSQTFGAGSLSHETFAAVAEAHLQKRHDGPVEIGNMGTSGYGSLQAIRLMKHRLADWAADLYILDTRTFDQPRDEFVSANASFPTLERLLFNWRTYYVLRFAIERARGNTRGMTGNDAGRHGHLGNHEQILAEARAQDVPLISLDYPVWYGGNTIKCLVSAADLPQGIPVVETCDALQNSGVDASELFYDRNHLRPAGNVIVGKVLAEYIENAGLIPQ